MPSTAGAIRAGRAYVEAFLDARQVEKGIRRLRVRLDSFAKQVGTLGRNFAVAGVALLTPLALAVEKASDLQETMNKFDVVFADRKDEVKEWGDAFADQVGRSKKQVADFLASSQDLFVPLGFDAGSAEDLSKGLTGLAIDVASFNNKVDSDVLRDFHAALTGGGETVKKYGVIMNVAGEKAELLNMGINPSNATNAQKVMARYNILLRGTTAAQGDAVRSGDAWANQQKALMGKLDDLAATVGTKLLPAITPYLAMLVDGVAATGEFIAENETLVTVGAAVGGILTLVGGGLLGLAAAAKLASIALSTLVATKRLLIAMKGPLMAVFAVTAIVLMAREIYNLNASIQQLNASMKQSIELDQQLFKRRGNRQQETLQKADTLQGDERQQFLSNELEMAEKNLAGMQASLRGQKKLVDELAPTWKSLWQAGRANWNVEKQQIDSINEGIAQQKEFVEALRKAQRAQQEELETNQGRTDEQMQGIESILSRLNEELETFGMDAGEKAIRELEKLNANESELASAREKLAALSEKQAEDEARKAQEEELKRAEEEAEQAAKTIADMLQSLSDEVSDLHLDPKDREREAKLRELTRLGANQEQLEQAGALLDEKASLLDDSSASPQRSFSAQGGTFSSLASLAFGSGSGDPLKDISESSRETADNTRKIAKSGIQQTFTA